jgi:hypothetical protein
MKSFKKGDVVMVKGKPHMAGHKTGTVVTVSPDTAYAIQFDGDDEPHKWYVDSELESHDDSMGMGKAIRRLLSTLNRD